MSIDNILTNQVFNRLSKRIKREFKIVKYIGDIKITDDEYALLEKYLILSFKDIAKGSSQHSNDVVLATALVHFGIRNYDGRFWPHFKNLFPFDTVTQAQCSVLGQTFIYILKSNNKICHGYDEMVNSILMHAFITEYYAKDFFDFLYMYYERDLDRNLENHTKEMRNYLIDSMKRVDNTARSYKIKKHTSDAVTANENGCKIRIRRILKMIDDYMFNGNLQENSSNRVTQLFVEWAKKSKDFQYARREYSGGGGRGRKRFSSPILKFDTSDLNFYIAFPVQNIPLEDEELESVITWKISYNGYERIISVETEPSVTGCKTAKCAIEIPSYDIFANIKIELMRDDECVRKFIIRGEDIKFFDSDWESIYVDDNYVPSGECFAFSLGEAKFICSTKEEVEKCAGLNLYTLYLKEDDFIVYPSGKVKPVGKEFEDKISQQNAVPGAYVLDGENNKKYNIFSSSPVICFIADEKQLPGTLVWINGNKFRLEENDFVQFSFTANKKRKGCILNLDTYNLKDGKYSVAIDIPGSKKEYYFEFAIIKDFGFKFVDAPYIFKTEGTIVFNDGLTVESADGETDICGVEGHFEIFPDFDFLSFNVATTAEMLNVIVYTPVFKYKFDDYEWEVSKPDPIWYTEFPKFIYIKIPDDSVIFSMDIPEVLGFHDDENEDDYQTSFKKNKETHVFECDTTKMLSWFGRQDALRALNIEFGNKKFIFTHIVTKCILNQSKLSFDADYKSNEFVLKADIIGIADCYIDLIFDDVVIAEKVEIRTKGARIPVPLKNGEYTVVFYEQDDDEDEFGFGEIDYAEFNTKKFRFNNKYDFSGRKLLIRRAVENIQISTIFAPESYQFCKQYYIDDITVDNENPHSFYGILNGDKKDIPINVYFELANTDKPDRIFLYDNSKSEKSFFSYAIDKSLSPECFGKGLKRLKPNEWYFEVTVK